MKHWKHSLFLLTVLAAVLTIMLTVSAFSADSVAEGDFNDGIMHWSLSADNVLTITGSGAMDDYEYASSPWSAYSGCGSLQDVYFTGTEEDWAAMEIATGNDCLLRAKRYSLDKGIGLSLAVNERELTVSYWIEPESAEDTVLYCCIYDEQGRMSGIEELRIDPSANGAQTETVALSEDAAKVNMFAVDMMSLIPARSSLGIRIA